MPRSSSRQNSATKPAVPSIPVPQSQWVMIAEENLFRSDGNKDNTMNICKLRHPKSEQPAMYLICNGGETISEMVKFSPQFGSWLIGESVQKDGSLIVTTPVDPVFLILPYLINAGKSGKFMTLDQIVHDADFPDCSRLLDCQGMQSLDQVSDMRGADDIQAYRYSSEKTLAWLSMKTENVIEALRKSEVRVAESGAHSADFVRSKKDSLEGEEAYLKYAHGLISDYLPVDLAANLRQHLGIKETKENIKPDTKGDEPPSKKAKFDKDDLTPTEDYSANNKGALKKENSKGKQTAAQKRLGKVDKTGMKSISSFFSAKS